MAPKRALSEKKLPVAKMARSDNNVDHSTTKNEGSIVTSLVSKTNKAKHVDYWPSATKPVMEPQHIQFSNATVTSTVHNHQDERLPISPVKTPTAHHPQNNSLLSPPSPKKTVNYSYDELLPLPPPPTPPEFLPPNPALLSPPKTPSYAIFDPTIPPPPLPWENVSQSASTSDYVSLKDRGYYVFGFGTPDHKSHPSALQAMINQSEMI